MVVFHAAPRSEAELLERAHGIAGWRFDALARMVGMQVPQDLRRHKGWVGQLLEAVLGATAGSRPEPDFVHVGVELKTIPLDRRGEPRESTFVCTAALTALPERTWVDSQVKKKLTRVLWIPVEADPDISMEARKVGSPLLWSPGPEDEAILRKDWEDILELIADGYVESITAERGRYLQMRPKGANRKQRTWGIDDEGGRFRTPPRGFYLRRTFIQTILDTHFLRGRMG